MTNRVLIDSGPLVALLSERDQYRQSCLEMAATLPAIAQTCWPVVTEVAYLLRRHAKRRDDFLSKCDGSRFEILSLTADDLPAIRFILFQYRDQGFDFADACLMHLSVREGIERVFTLDRRHFSIFRTTAGAALTLIAPE